MIKCEECGRDFLCINATHLAKHEMTVAEYKKKYGFHVVDESVGKKVSEKNKGRINLGEKNGAKKVDVKKRISDSVKKKWENGDYNDRINGMLGKCGELNPNYKPELYSLTYLAEKKYREFLSEFQDISQCSRCSNISPNVHHIDEDHKNFLPSNLEPLCVGCHMAFHYGKQKLPFISVGKIVTFAAAHRLPDYTGPCANWHGHEWSLCVTVKKRIDPKTGMVIDFSELKRIMTKCVLDKFDHSIINNTLYNPTAENILVWVWESLMFDGLLKGIEKLELYETPTSIATLDKQGMLSIFSSKIEDYLIKHKKEM